MNPMVDRYDLALRGGTCGLRTGCPETHSVPQRGLCVAGQGPPIWPPQSPIDFLVEIYDPEKPYWDTQ